MGEANGVRVVGRRVVVPYRVSKQPPADAGDDPCGEEIFLAGIELIDPGGSVGVCSAHDPILGNNVILITYDLEIRTTVAPGDIINTATLLRYAGEEGGPNHVPTPSPLEDDATVTIQVPVTPPDAINTVIVLETAD